MNSEAFRWSAASTAVAPFCRPGSRSAGPMIALCVAVLGACSDSSGPDPDPGPTPVATVEVAAAATTFEIGGLLQLTATARDASGNVLSGRATTWSSTNLGVATVNSAGLVNGVASGTATINATVGGVTGGIQVTVTAPPPVILSSVSPNPLVPGQSATLTGSGFSTVAAANVVSLGGTTATVAAATTTSLTVTVPATLCAAPGPVEVSVTVGGRKSNPIQQPAQTGGTAVSAATGQMQFLQSGFCLQFAASAATDTFLIGVQNYSEDVTNVVPVTFAMSGALPGPVYAAESAPPAARAGSLESPQVDPARALRWVRHRQAELALRRSERSLPIPDLSPAARGGTARGADGVMSIPAVVNVGDNVPIRVPDRTNLCDGFTAITTVVKYVGTKSVWLEDTGNPAGGFTASDYQSLATMFDNQIFATVVDYFGNPSDIDGNGRIVIIVTKEVNNANILGFTTTADLTSCASSDNGEIYYTRAVDPNGQVGDAYTLLSALADAPQLLAHEVAHIAQFTIRAGQIGFLGILPSIWELEGQATLSEEVVGHAVTGRSPGQNYGFDVAFNCVVGSSPCQDAGGIAWYIGSFVDMALYYGFDPDAANPQQTPIGGAPEQCSWLNLASNGNSGPCFSGREVYGVPFLLLRYISDQYGPQFPGGEKALHRNLILGNRAGFDNISNLIGQPMDRVLAEWAATLYLDDRITAPAPRLRFASWNLFGIEQRLVNPARLRPRVRTFSTFSDQVLVRAGSTAYFLVTGAHAASALRVRGTGEANLPSNMRVWIVRIR